MREITPTTRDIQRNYINHRRMADSVGYGYSLDEFDRWIAAHDQGIRDAVKPPELTAKEHLKAAFDKAHPVPKDRDVPPGVPIIARFANGEIWVHTTGWSSVIHHHMEVRTLEPLPVIPDDCNAVWASTREDESRRVWVRVTGFTPGLADAWDDGNLDADFAQASDLIDPVPVPEEER